MGTFIVPLFISCSNSRYAMVTVVNPVTQPIDCADAMTHL